MWNLLLSVLTFAFEHSPFSGPVAVPHASPPPFEYLHFKVSPLPTPTLPVDPSPHNNEAPLVSPIPPVVESSQGTAQPGSTYVESQVQTITPVFVEEDEPNKKPGFYCLDVVSPYKCPPDFPGLRPSPTPIIVPASPIPVPMPSPFDELEKINHTPPKIYGGYPVEPNGGGGKSSGSVNSSFSQSE